MEVVGGSNTTFKINFLKKTQIILYDEMVILIKRSALKIWSLKEFTGNPLSLYNIYPMHKSLI